MAFQIDPNIPLRAMANPINIGDAFAKAQSYQVNALKLQALREQFNEEKEARLRQKQMRQGMASELQKMQQGTPAQYRTTFPQTMPTGQMPQGMTGVLASERGQNLPQPALFGENILQGNFDINRELVSPEIAPKQPDIKDILMAQFNAAVANNDVATAFDASKKLKELEKSPNKYFQGLTEAIDPVTKQPILLAMTEGGAVPSGYSPKPKEKEQKAPITWKVGKGRTEETWGYDAKGNQVLLGVQSLDAPRVEKPDPVTQALAIAQGKEDIKLAADQRAKVAEKYANASDVIPLLDSYISVLKKTPANLVSSMYYKAKGLASDENPELDALAVANQKAKTLVNYAQKETGPQTDRDVANYLEQVGIASDITLPRSSRLAAAESAKEYAQIVYRKYGNYASDILSGEVTPKELETEPSKPTRSKDELFKLYKEFKADYEAEKDPAMRKIMIDAARADGLIK